MASETAARSTVGARPAAPRARARAGRRRRCHPRADARGRRPGRRAAGGAATARPVGAAGGRLGRREPRPRPTGSPPTPATGNARRPWNKATLGCGMLRQGEVDIGSEPVRAGRHLQRLGRAVGAADRPSSSPTWWCCSPARGTSSTARSTVSGTRRATVELRPLLPVGARPRHPGCSRRRGSKVVVLTHAVLLPARARGPGRARLARVRAVARRPHQRALPRLPHRAPRPATRCIDLNRLRVTGRASTPSSIDDVRVRDDGVHFSLDGADYVSAWLVPQLRDLLARLAHRPRCRQPSSSTPAICSPDVSGCGVHRHRAQLPLRRDERGRRSSSTRGCSGRATGDRGGTTRRRPSREPEWLAPDYVYLTHHHFDHFHFPSMRRIDRARARARAGVRRRRARRRGAQPRLRRGDGAPARAGACSSRPEVRVASYQYGTDDTVFVVADGDEVLVDINDGKIRGRTAAPAPRRVRPADLRVQELLVRAGATRRCYTADDPADLELITRDSYLDDWMRVVERAGAGLRRAVRQHGRVPAPGEPARRTGSWSRPSEVVATFGGSGTRARGTEAVQMDPGDRWSADDGLRARRRRLVRRPRASASTTSRAAGRSRGSTRRPRPRRASPSTTPRSPTYFDALHARVPARRARPGSRSAGRWCSRCRRRALPFWVLDFDRARGLPAVVAAARHREHRAGERGGARRRHRQAPGARRARVDADRASTCSAGGAGDDITFWALLVPWELGYLPVQRSVGHRLAEVGWRRRNEWLEWVDAAARRRLRLPLRAPLAAVHHRSKSEPAIQ